MRRPTAEYVYDPLGTAIYQYSRRQELHAALGRHGQDPIEGDQPLLVDRPIRVSKARRVAAPDHVRASSNHRSAEVVGEVHDLGDLLPAPPSSVVEDGVAVDHARDEGALGGDEPATTVDPQAHRRAPRRASLARIERTPRRNDDCSRERCRDLRRRSHLRAGYHRSSAGCPARALACAPPHGRCRSATSMRRSNAGSSVLDELRLDSPAAHARPRLRCLPGHRARRRAACFAPPRSLLSPARAVSRWVTARRGRCDCLPSRRPMRRRPWRRREWA